MANSNNNIENIILDEIFSVMDIKIYDLEANLLSSKCNIEPIDMLYILENIEKRTQTSMSSIFTENDHSILTVKNLAKAITNLIIKNN